MMMMRALTPTQARALELALDHGAALIRLPGGFWTYPGCPAAYVLHGPNGDTDVPETHVGTLTVDALIRRGFLTVTETQTSRNLTGRTYEYPVAVTVADGVAVPTEGATT